MTEAEKILANDEICKMLGWESNRVYVYHVPNLFPFKEDAGTTEFMVQDIFFDRDWNMCVGAYNNVLKRIINLHQTQRDLYNHHKNFIVRYGAQNFFEISDVTGQVNISSCYLKLADFAKWYNGVTVFKK